MTRSQFGCFCAGIAAGAAGRAYYPKIKEKLSPVLSAGAAIMTEAFSKAAKDAAAAAESMTESTIRMAQDVSSDSAGSHAA